MVNCSTSTLHAALKWFFKDFFMNNMSKYGILHFTMEWSGWLPDPTMGTNPVCLTGTLDAGGKFSLAAANETKYTISNRDRLKPWLIVSVRFRLVSSAQIDFISTIYHGECSEMAIVWVGVTVWDCYNGLLLSPTSINFRRFDLFYHHEILLLLAHKISVFLT